MTFYQTLQEFGLPCIYGVYKEDQPVPYITYTGYGQDIFYADNGAYQRINLYQIVYYYKSKNEANEDQIEAALLDKGYTYDKSEDYYDSSENIYYIIYSNIKSLKGGR